MPGDRMTRQDRRQIAAGLTAGLSYREIARRLERSTSTVTREVTRNGGASGYRADRAQQAARTKARRGRNVPGTPPARTAAAPRPQVREFEARLAALYVDRGMQRMPARVLACLYTDDNGSLTTAELVDLLQVSPASISKAVAYLEGQGLIRREREGRQRKDRYVIDTGMWFRAVVSGMRLNTVLAETAREGADIVGKRTRAGHRLNDMGDFLDHISQAVVEGAERWHEAYRARGGPA